MLSKKLFIPISFHYDPRREGFRSAHFISYAIHEGRDILRTSG
jgi:hypothetical protein